MPIFTNVLRRNWLSAILQPRTAILLGLLGLCRPAVSQEVSAALLQPAAMESSSFTPSPAFTPARPATLPEATHRFWDRENTLLFATSAAFNAADFIVTRDNLRSGGKELNPVTRVFSGSTPGLAVNFAGETAGVVALSYFFHKTGHHNLERFTSMLNIGSSAAAVTFDLAHR
jgi:CubicO group peptidase (beta-lactamase class C family)